MNKSLLGLAIAAAVAASSCSSTQQIVDLEKSSSQTLTMKVGETKTVQLRENPSTGYAWRVNTSEQCNASVGNTKYVQDKAADKMIGVGGLRSYEIKADKKGNCTIIFEQTPPGRSEVVNKKEVNIIVK